MKKIAVYCFLCLFVLLMPAYAKAANSAYMSDGNILFETTDTKATSNVRWMTAGFTIRKEKSGGNPVCNHNYAELHLQSQYQNIKDNGDGTYQIIYTIPKKKVDKALIAAGLDGIKDNDTIYFNTVFKIKAYGVVQGRKYYTLSGIKGAAGWRNPKDFNEHFDIGIKFKSAKYDVDIEYKSTTGELIKKKHIGKWKAGKEVMVTLDGEKTYEGKRYVLCKSYYLNLSKPSKRKNVKKVQKEDYGKSQNQSGTLKIGGMKIIAIMKPEQTGEWEPNPEPEPVPEEQLHQGKEPKPIEVIEKELNLEDIWAEASLAAEEKGQEQYDAKTAVPSGERLYAEGSAERSLLEYQFTCYKGSTVYAVTIKADYKLLWKELTDDGWKWKSRLVDGTKTVYVEREYSYWAVDYFNYYAAGNMVIENKTLPDGMVKMEHTLEDMEYVYRKTDHTYNKKEEITINKGTMEQIVDSRYSSPSYLAYESIAENKVGRQKAANDYLELNGTVLLDDTICEEKTEKPVDLPESNGTISYFKGDLTIPATTKNGAYESKGTVYYELKVSAVEGASSEDTYGCAETLSCAVSEMNPVVVHTPVVCTGSLSDHSDLCQSMEPNPARCQLVLGTSFAASISCYGEHLDYKGYGIQDYSRFCSTMEICFPFDIYREEQFYPAGVWQAFDGSGIFYLPSWVKEGEYTVQFRSVAKNNISDISMDRANLDPDYGIAECSVAVEISGRIYGLNISDISDYPLWRPVFRKENSNEFSGAAFYVGTKNQNGIDTGLNPIYTLPVLAGTHPLYKNAGGTKTGYFIRGSLKTLGSFFHEKDTIEIVPQFYYVDSKGKNREQVDIYYDQTVDGEYRKLIRIGSERDQLNKRVLSLDQAKFYVSDQQLSDTAAVFGIDVSSFLSQETIWGGYQSFHIPSALRTFTGISGLLGAGRQIPSGMSNLKIQRSKQNWFFEYLLPSVCHIAPYGYDVEGCAKMHSIDYRENFWKTGGYLIVQFSIYACHNGDRELSYLNLQNEVNGYCNMWKKEGYRYLRTDENDIHFELKDGDFLVFPHGQRQSGSTGEDYESGGTH